MINKIKDYLNKEYYIEKHDITINKNEITIMYFKYYLNQYNIIKNINEDEYKNDEISINEFNEEGILISNNYTLEEIINDYDIYELFDSDELFDEEELIKDIINKLNNKFHDIHIKKDYIIIFNELTLFYEKDYNNKKEIIKEIGSNLFSGFYESIYLNSDEFYDIEKEDEEYIKNKYALEDIEVIYEYEDINEYMKNICNCFMDEYINHINNILPLDIINDEDYLFERTNDEILIISPKYYNYTTDKCYANIKTNYYTLNLIKEYTLHLKGCEDYIYKQFTSRDGYISFITNNYREWKNTNIEDYEENILIALLDMLITLNNKEDIYDIEYEVVDTINKYEYVYPTIYDYTTYETTELHEYIETYLNKQINNNLNKPIQYKKEAYNYI